MGWNGIFFFVCVFILMFILFIVGVLLLLLCTYVCCLCWGHCPVFWLLREEGVDN